MTDMDPVLFKESGEQTKIRLDQAHVDYYPSVVGGSAEAAVVAFYKKRPEPAASWGWTW